MQFEDDTLKGGDTQAGMPQITSGLYLGIRLYHPATSQKELLPLRLCNLVHKFT